MELQPTPQTFIDNMTEYLNGVSMPEAERVLFLKGANYMYNIGQVYVNNLKDIIEQYIERVKELEQQIDSLTKNIQQ